MWTRSLVALVVAYASASTALAADCSLGLSASSASSWQVACADQTGTGASVTAFDPSALSVVRIGDFSAVELKPATKPEKVLVPMTFGNIGKLISPTLTTFSLERDEAIKGKPEVKIDGDAFAQMTALQKLSFSYVKVDIEGLIQLPPTLSELSFTHTGLVDFKESWTKGALRNVTKIDLSYNNLRRIPLIVFTSKKIITIDLSNNKFPGLRLSRRKLRRLLRLIAAKKIIMGEVADFIEDCKDGEKKTVQLGKNKYVVCEVEKEEDDNLVVEEASASTSGSIDTGSSTSGSEPSEPTTEPPASSSSSSTTPITNTPVASNTPKPTSSSSSLLPLSVLTATGVAMVWTALLG